MIERASNFLEEFSQTAACVAMSGHTIASTLRYDEVGLQIELIWAGTPLPVASSVSIEADDVGLQITLMRHWTDELHCSVRENGQHTLVAYIDDR